MEFDVRNTVPEILIGWSEAELPKSVMMRLQNYIETAKKNPVNNNVDLAGNISKSLLIVDKDNWFFENVLLPLIHQYMECYPYYRSQVDVLTEDAPYCLESFWVNFQKQHEFNPPHDHSGAFSFVIWVKIPTDWREQHALPISANSNSPRSSDFEFLHTTMLGDIAKTAYFLDKNSEGKMLFFPAKLTHQVFPFYECDKERISISGNISFKNFKP